MVLPQVYVAVVSDITTCLMANGQEVMPHGDGLCRGLKIRTRCPLSALENREQLKLIGL